MKSILFHPFENYSEKQLLSIGLLFASISIYLASILGGHFDGAIDVHLVSQQVPLLNVFIESLISVLSLVLLIYIFGKIYNSKTRFIDIVITVLIARIPLYLILVFNINFFYSDLALSLGVDPAALQNLPKEVLINLLLVSLLIFGFVIWFFVLLWNGFKTATNAKGSKPVILFIVAVILAEVVSKFILNYTQYVV